MQQKILTKIKQQQQKLVKLSDFVMINERRIIAYTRRLIRQYRIDKLKYFISLFAYLLT